jgi:hypothetical protein
VFVVKHWQFKIKSSLLNEKIQHSTCSFKI